MNVSHSARRESGGAAPTRGVGVGADEVTSRTRIRHPKEYPQLVRLVTEGWAKGTPETYEAAFNLFGLSSTLENVDMCVTLPMLQK